MGINSGSDTLNWTTSIDGETLTHDYTSPFEVSTYGGFYDVAHSVTGVYRVGSTDYQMTTRRSEGVC